MTDNGTGKALISLTVSEGKRLIGKAVAALPQVQAARKQGKLIIATGITNAYVAEESFRAGGEDALHRLCLLHKAPLQLHQ